MADSVEAESNLETYKSQLSHVINALELESGDLELISLKNDLVEIIAITENELLNLKKSQLLLSLEEDQVSSSSVENEEDSIESFVGMKCSIPYTTAWGSFQQQNCIILSVELSDESETTVKLLFLTPSSTEMLPCKNYLNSECRFEKCKYSHGFEVGLSVLCDYQEPNFDNFERGKRCLCKNENDMWVPGTVTKVNTDDIYVKLDGSGSETVFTYDNIFPLLSNNNDDNDSLTELSSSDLSSIECQPLPKLSQNLNFGQWEEHTNSFGSKMLLKMGYTPGKGLGPRGEGILEPIEADIIPIGVSLDTIKEMREKRLLRTVYKLNVILKKKADQKADFSNNKIKKVNSMFNMIDNIMLKNETTKQKQINNPKNKKPINKVTEKTVRLKSVTIENDVIRCKHRISDLKQSLVRNRNDNQHCSRVQVQIKEESEKLEALFSKQQSVENEIKMRTDKKKLKIF